MSNNLQRSLLPFLVPKFIYKIIIKYAEENAKSCAFCVCGWNCARIFGNAKIIIWRNFQSINRENDGFIFDPFLDSQVNLKTDICFSSKNWFSAIANWDSNIIINNLFWVRLETVRCCCFFTSRWHDNKAENQFSKLLWTPRPDGMNPNKIKPHQAPSHVSHSIYFIQYKHFIDTVWPFGVGNRQQQQKQQLKEVCFPSLKLLFFSLILNRI